MPRYSVTGAVHGSTWIGEYDANTPEEAIERAYNDAGISLCHECARSVSDPEVCGLTAEDVETGDATSEATTNDQIVGQAREIERLLAACENAVNVCPRDCTPESYCGVCGVLFAAIAKAKGETK